MVAQPPRPAPEKEAQQSPTARLEAIAMRSDNPAKRAIDVMCVVLLQLLILMVLVDEKDPEKRRSCYVLAPDSILTKLEQGFDFGLPGPIVASIRLAVRILRAEYNLGQDYVDWLTTPDAEAPKRLRSPRGNERRRGPHRMEHRQRHIPAQHRSGRPTPARIALGHHPPPHPPPFQNASVSTLQTRVRNVASP